MLIILPETCLSKMYKLVCVLYKCTVQAKAHVQVIIKDDFKCTSSSNIFKCSMLQYTVEKERDETGIFTLVLLQGKRIAFLGTFFNSRYYPTVLASQRRTLFIAVLFSHKHMYGCKIIRIPIRRHVVPQTPDINHHTAL